VGGCKGSRRGTLYAAVLLATLQHQAPPLTTPLSLSAPFPAPQIVAAPLAAGLLATDGHVPGLAGWQTLFLAQGAATVAFAGLLRARLPRSLGDAPFLADADRAWLAEQKGAALGAPRHGASRDGGGDGSKEVELGHLGAPRGLQQQQNSQQPRPQAAAPPLPEGEESDLCRLLPPQAAASGATEEAAPPRPLGAWQQVAACAANPRIRYLVLVKMLKVGRRGRGRGGGGGEGGACERVLGQRGRSSAHCSWRGARTALLAGHCGRLVHTP
jgi:hypothetical protein